MNVIKNVLPTYNWCSHSPTYTHEITYCIPMSDSGGRVLYGSYRSYGIFGIRYLYSHT